MHRSWPCRASTPKLRTLSTLNASPKLFNILFFGRDEFSVLVFDQLYAAYDIWQSLSIVTYPPERVGRRGSQIRNPPLRLHAESACPDVGIHEIPSVKSNFRHWKPPFPFSISPSTPPASNLLVTASFGRILSKSHLAHFTPSNRLNVHPSLLPLYRGPAPIQHTLLNGERKTGVCVVEMLERNRGIDSGPVWGCEKTDVGKDEMFISLRDRLGVLGGQLLVSILRDMLVGKAVSTPPSISPDTPTAPFITAVDSIVDFTTMTAEDILRRHRAISHQRPLTTFLPTSKAVHLHQPHSMFFLHHSDLPAEPSMAKYDSASGSIIVRCAGDTFVAFREVKTEGKACMRAKDWWNGVRGSGWWGGGEGVRFLKEALI